MKKFSFTLHLVLMLGSFGLGFTAAAQKRDYGLWTGADISQKLNKRISLNLAGELKFKDTLTKVDEFLTEFGLGVKINSHFDLFGGYRLGRSAEEDAFYTNHRFTVGAKTDWDISRLKVVYNMRYEFEFAEVYTNGYNLEESKRVRGRVSVEYNLPNSKLTPFFSAELFYDMSPNKEREFNRIRYRLGSDFAINKRNKLEVFAQYQKNMNAKTDKSSMVLGLFYSFEMKQKKEPIETRPQETVAE
ncbi:DUF2490 domain-containing protein [Williamwhitmania taraxaci]|uniref:DUF2490 domain-containing protein n=1 Tax=Williamwhitmania taraxaci TaxID=1640674 RepID=A0A1G6KIG8_9BACT|nr:DUF2490 domain-containing protein [Williamwhitmania taraxaci]SDC30820.1 Protein of unknown function [Williamwhitmania taraxaci]